MSNSTRISDNTAAIFGDVGFGRFGAIGKQILNSMEKLADRPAERRRLAALPLRQLEDIGMTVAERDALLR